MCKSLRELGRLRLTVGSGQLTRAFFCGGTSLTLVAHAPEYSTRAGAKKAAAAAEPGLCDSRSCDCGNCRGEVLLILTRT